MPHGAATDRKASSDTTHVSLPSGKPKARRGIRLCLVEPNSVIRGSESEFRSVVVKADRLILSPAMSYGVWQGFPRECGIKLRRITAVGGCFYHRNIR